MEKREKETGGVRASPVTGDAFLRSGSIASDARPS